MIFSRTLELLYALSRTPTGPPEAVTMVEQKVGLCLIAASNAKSSGVTRPLSPQTLTRKCGLFVRADNHHPMLKAFTDLVLELFEKRVVGPLKGSCARFQGFSGLCGLAFSHKGQSCKKNAIP
jgi:hypothetical protein